VHVSVRVAAFLIVLGGTAAASFAVAQPARELDMSAEARERFRRGAALAEQRDYDGAAREFEAAYQIDPRKDALFAWAQSERLGGNCLKAVELYRKFLASRDLTPAQTDAAQRPLERCERVVEQARAEEALRAKPPAPAAPTVVAPASPPPQRRTSIVPALLLGGGVAALAAAGAFYLLSRGDESDARAAVDNYGDYFDAVTRARDKQRIAAVAGAGGVLLVGGALLGWLGPWGDKEGVSAWTDGRGGGIALARRY
jgi:hypothetical protein